VSVLVVPMWLYCASGWAAWIAVYTLTGFLL
jgi:hypothetical protein